MKMPEIRLYEMFERVDRFGAAHADRFPATGVSGGLFAAVGTVVDKLTAYGVAQTHRIAREHSSTRATARATIRGLLRRIRRTVNAIEPPPPGLTGKFVVPRSNSDRRLLLAAQAFVQDATPLRDQLVAHHLSPTFLDDLTAAINTFSAATQAQAELRETAAAARAGIEDATNSGMAAVDRLDAVVPNALEQERDLLAEWYSARHVSQVSIPYASRKRAAEPAPAPASTPVSMPATPGVVTQ